MIRSKKLIRNIFIIAVMFFIFFRCSNLYLTPLSAHEHSERSIHYGPSQVIHTENYEKGKYILCKYDKWISCNTVKRSLLLFWSFGTQPVGFKNKEEYALDYTWHVSDQYCQVYGAVNDKRVQKVRITLSNGETKAQTDFYGNLFLFTWESPGDTSIHLTRIQGFDAHDKEIYTNDGYGN